MVMELDGAYAMFFQEILGRYGWSYMVGTDGWMEFTITSMITRMLHDYLYTLCHTQFLK